MNYWIEYFPSSGRIVMVIESQSEPSPEFGGAIAQVARGVDASKCMYVDGAVLDLGPPPGEGYAINYLTGSWVANLGAVRDAKWEQIKAERDRRETSGFPYLDRWIDSDSRSVQRITGAVQSAQAALGAGVPFEIDWTCADNGVITLDAQQMLGMTVALASHANGLHVIARGLREQIYAADATAESVALLSWPVDGQVG